MGVIIASFPGCGMSYLEDNYGDKMKVVDHSVSDKKNEEYVEEVKGLVSDCDILFIRPNVSTLESLCDNGVDFDVFYPNFDKVQEIIEDCVKKRVPSKAIATLDHKYPDIIKALDAIDDEHCFKHKLAKGQYLCTDEQLSKFLKSYE